jgi:hypothetical protein
MNQKGKEMDLGEVKQNRRLSEIKPLYYPA